MSLKLPTVEEVKAQIKAEDDNIEAARGRKKLLAKQLKLSTEMGQITELNGQTSTPERITEVDGITG